MAKKSIIWAVIVFFITYALFSIAGFLFPIDREWYDALNKPEWTPSGGVSSVRSGLSYSPSFRYLLPSFMQSTVFKKSHYHFGFCFF